MILEVELIFLNKHPTWQCGVSLNCEGRVSKLRGGLSLSVLVPGLLCELLPSRRVYKHGGMCLLVAQTMASELLSGGGGRRECTKIITAVKLFPLERGAPFLFVSPSLGHYNICPQAEVMILVHILFPRCCSCCSRRVFLFFASQACCSTKIASPFVGGAVHTGVVYVHFLGFVSDYIFFLLGGVDKQRLFAPFVLMVSIT